MVRAGERPPRGGVGHRLSPATRAGAFALLPCVACAGAIALLVGIACARAPLPAPDVVAPSPLTGRFWQVDAQRFVSEPELVAALAARRFVLLGEMHDDAAHHRIQAGLLAGMVAAGRHPAVVFEMIDRDRAAPLAAALAAPDTDAEAVRRAVAWDTSGWPDWSLYAPLFRAALAARLPLAAGDLDAADLHALREGGIAGLPAARRRALALDTPVPAAWRDVLAEALREGHCGLLPEAALPTLVDVQLARDAQLAHALREAGGADVRDAAGADGAVLVAGAGHTRRDVAVPAWLVRQGSLDDVLSLALLEVEPDARDPQRVLEEHFDGPAPYDVVGFTAPQPREDPCERLRRQLAPGGDAPR